MKLWHVLDDKALSLLLIHLSGMEFMKKTKTP